MLQIIILADLNFPDVNWDSLQSPNPQLEDLISIIDMIFVEQMVMRPTCGNNILDLISMTSDIVSNIEFFKSKLTDHNIVLVNTLLSFVSNKLEKIRNGISNPFEKLNLGKCDREE